MAGERLAQTISNLRGGLSSNFLFGVVTGIKPIKIKIEGLPELKETQIILSDNVKKKKIKIPTNDKPKHKHAVNTLTTTPGGEDSHTHTIPAFETQEALEEITLWEDLKKGDKVFVIQSNDKQMFYVLEVIKE